MTTTSEELLEAPIHNLESEVEYSRPDIKGILERSIVATNSDDLRRALQAETRGEMAPELKEVLSTLVGLRLAGIQGMTGTEDFDEGATFVAALEGDADAIQLVDIARRLAADHDASVRHERTRAQEEYLRSEAHLKEEDIEARRTPEVPDYYPYLSMVHATNYEPVRSKTTGRRAIQSSFTDTGVPRSTIHVALNHMVESSYASSDWGDASIVVVSPMEKVVELNGEPTSLIAHDTWFEVAPHEGLELPEDTIIIKPGASQPVQVVSSPSGVEIRYMNQGIGGEHVDQLFEDAGDYELLLLAQELRLKVEVDSSRHGADLGWYGYLEDTEMPMYVTHLRPGEKDKIKQALADMVDQDRKGGEALFARLAKRVAVRQALALQGHEVLEPLTTMHTQFMSDDLSADFTKFIISRDTSGHHSEAEIYGLEKAIYWAMDDDKSLKPEEISRLKQLVTEGLHSVSMNTLQMYYRLGLL
jgi:hypothetical protein